MKRTDIINLLIKKYQYKSYLEIGTQWPASNFDKIDVDYKFSIEPFPVDKVDFIGTSDAYFESITNDTKFDIIFIDGLHHNDQVLKDIQNSLNYLNEGGFILLHDCNPPEEFLQLVPRQSGLWNGDVWKSIVKLRCLDPNLEISVVDTDWGVGVVRRGSQKLYDKASIHECLTWEYFDKNRDELVNIISVEEFFEKYKKKILNQMLF